MGYTFTVSKEYAIFASSASTLTALSDEPSPELQ